MAKRAYQVTVSSPPKSWRKKVEAQNVAAAARAALSDSPTDELHEDVALTIIVTPS